MLDARWPRDPDPAVLFCTPPVFIAFDLLPVERQDVRHDVPSSGGHSVTINTSPR